MPRDLRPGPDSPPADELQAAEDTLGVLRHVLHTIADDDLSRQTPCTEFDVAKLTEHLLKSIGGIGRIAGAEFPEREPGDSVERQIISVARPVLDAWHRRGLDGNVPFGKGEMSAKSACGIFSIEFLVHAWDYAAAVGRDVEAPEPLAEYVLDLAHNTIRPEFRGAAGFDDPVGVPADASALVQLVAFTGRNPAG
ncbi:TIGR03086 family metal-binding protein [Mycobacterium sp. Aquia_216]|uniref:TIGR03086 family metal-binding protein n=1 Tax=Mycobacterium sp. Aquia_216 TaxID=2991729 RepID=UPI00227C2AB9|nr:TIGR03086 family metal-binding protein [Mycobacterium sp. Aquia_216]WAJ45076.1 TIGR03086 family metal-binding protein [Mycobacterium sp. Aquia_216]